MIATCRVCGCDIELSDDEFLAVDQEIEEYYCNDCGQAAIMYSIELKERMNEN